MQVYEERFFQMYFRIFDEVYYMYTASVCSTVTISGKETSYRTASTYMGYGFLYVISLYRVTPRQNNNPYKF